MNTKRRNPLEKSSSRKRVARNSTKTDKTKRSLKLLDGIKGIGEGIWNEDAQHYVNRLRDNDR